MSTWAIVVAGGSGERFGQRKQYLALRGERVLDWSLRAARAHVDGVVLVVPADSGERPEPLATVVVTGGATRSASVRAGLAVVPADAGTIIVHDAVRPVPVPAVWERVAAAVAAGADAAVPAVPVSDTLRQIDGATVDRERLVAVQTPQGFRAAALRVAHSNDPEGPDDASLVEAAGGRVVVVDGDPANIKITTPVDLELAESVSLTVRVGQGFDVHPFSDDPLRPLVLGGILFAGEPGLAGHSDADVVAHAVTDALLGAAGLGDIGQHFPDTDVSVEGADSIGLLRRAVADVRAAGWVPGNVDCTVILEAPKLAPRLADLQRALSEAVGAPVSVKGKRAEGLGALGRREGIACFAVAIVTGEG